MTTPDTGFERKVDTTGLVHFNDRKSEEGGLHTLCDGKRLVFLRDQSAQRFERGTCMHCADGVRRLNPDGTYKPTVRP